MVIRKHIILRNLTQTCFPFKTFTRFELHEQEEGELGWELLMRDEFLSTFQNLRGVYLPILNQKPTKSYQRSRGKSEVEEYSKSCNSTLTQLSLSIGIIWLLITFVQNQGTESQCKSHYLQHVLHLFTLRNAKKQINTLIKRTNIQQKHTIGD